MLLLTYILLLKPKIPVTVVSILKRSAYLTIMKATFFPAASFLTCSMHYTELHCIFLPVVVLWNQNGLVLLALQRMEMGKYMFNFYFFFTALAQRQNFVFFLSVIFLWPFFWIPFNVAKHFESLFHLLKSKLIYSEWNDNPNQLM